MTRRPVFSASFDSSDPVQLWFDIDRTILSLTSHIWGLSAQLSLTRHTSQSSQTKFLSTFRIDSYVAETRVYVDRFDKLVKRASDLGAKPADLRRIETLLPEFAKHTNYLRRVYRNGPTTPVIREGIRDIFGILFTLIPLFRLINEMASQEALHSLLDFIGALNLEHKTQDRRTS